MNHRWVRVAVAMAVVFAGVAATWTGVGAAVGRDVELESRIDGRAVKGAGANDAIPLGKRPQVDLRLTITNSGKRAVAVNRVKLEGTALGVTFLAYDVVVPVTVGAGQRRVVTVPLPLKDIKDQTVGLVPASISILGPTGAVLASQAFTVDVDGSMRSVFGTLGILIALFTILTMLLNLWLVIRRRLPPNRFFRGVRFAVPGAGIGLTICITLAATRVVAPYPSTWKLFVLVPAVAAFILGFISPGALAFKEDEVDVALRQRQTLPASS